MDELNVAQDFARISAMKDHAWYDRNHFGSTLQYFALSRLPGMQSVFSFRLTAVVFGCLLLWLIPRTLRREGFGPVAAGGFVLVCLVNERFLFWCSAWSLFAYAQWVLSGALAWMLLLRWRRRRFEETVVGIVGTCLLIAALVFNYLGSALPIGIAGLLALPSLRGRNTRPSSTGGCGDLETSNGSSRGLLNASIFAGTLAASALVTLRWFTHHQLAEPRSSIGRFYFSTRTNPDDGPVGWVVERSIHLLNDALRVPEAIPLPSWVPLLLFALGLLWALLGGHSAMRAAALMCIAQMAILALAGLASLLPYGEIRYTLPLQAMILVLVWYGGWTVLFPVARLKLTAQACRRAGLAMSLGAALIASTLLVMDHGRAGMENRSEQKQAMRLFRSMPTLPTVVDFNSVYLLRYLDEARHVQRAKDTEGSWLRWDLTAGNLVFDNDARKLAEAAPRAALEAFLGNEFRSLTHRHLPHPKLEAALLDVLEAYEPVESATGRWVVATRWRRRATAIGLDAPLGLAVVSGGDLQQPDADRGDRWKHAVHRDAAFQ